MMRGPPSLEMCPFIVYALPRSRTAWLSAFLTYRNWNCGHERMVTLREFDDLRALFGQSWFGTVETVAAPGRPLIHAVAPQIREVVVRRPVDEVMDSCRHLDISSVGAYDYAKLERNMNYLASCMAKISEDPEVVTVDFKDLDDPDVAADIFEFCLPFEFDRGWFEKLRGQNIQVDVVEHLKYCVTHRAELDKFRQICRRELRALVPKRPETV